MSEFECPTCENTYDTEKGLNLHHPMAHGESLTKVDTNCVNCGEVITVDGCQYERAKNNFCSHDCASEFKVGTKTGKDNPSYNSVMVNCDYCGDEIERAKSRTELTERYFCDRECNSKWLSEYRQEHQPQKTRVKVKCDNCGTTLERTPTRAENYELQFCDMDCQGEWRKGRTGPDAPQYKENLVECHNCGEEFHRMPSRTKRGVRQFCSVQCNNEWLSEHYTDPDRFHYGPGWNDEKKAKVRERDGHECVHCGMSKDEQMEKYGRNLNVHHKKPAKLFDDPEARNAMDNLETVCSSCHKKVEWLYPLRPA